MDTCTERTRDKKERECQKLNAKKTNYQNFSKTEAGRTSGQSESAERKTDRPF